MIKDTVVPARQSVIQRGVDEFLTLILVAVGPALAVFPVAELSRDRAWVLLAPRTRLRSFVGKVATATFTSGFVVFATAMVVTILGSYLLSFQPGLTWTSPSGSSEFPVELGVEAEKEYILFQGAGALTPLARASLFLFYPAWVLWVSVWGGILALFAIVFVLVLPWPRIGLFIHFVYWYASISMLGFVNLGLGSMSVDLAMFPTMGGEQAWYTPVAATVLYLLPAVIVGVWGWRWLERLPGFS